MDTKCKYINKLNVGVVFLRNQIDRKDKGWAVIIHVRVCNQRFLLTDDGESEYYLVSVVARR